MAAFPTFAQLISSIQSRIHTNGAAQITGQVHQDVLVDLVDTLVSQLALVSPEVLAAFPAWSNSTTYTGGEEVVVSYNDKLFLFVSGTDDLGTEPGTNSAVWKEVSALQLAHFQGTDQMLDQGGSNEVTAAELRALLDNPKSRWHDPVEDIVATPAGSEADGTRYLVSTGTGGFAGMDGSIVEKVNGAWQAYATTDGDAVRVKSVPGSVHLKDAGAWTGIVISAAERLHAPVNMVASSTTGSEVNGTRYAVASGAAGELAGMDGQIAKKVAGVWQTELCGEGDLVKVLGGKKLLHRNSGQWVDGSPNIQDVLIVGNDLGLSNLYMQLPIQWNWGTATHSSPGSFSPPWPTYARTLVAILADIDIRLTGGAFNSDFVLQLYNADSVPHAITWHSGEWIVNTWMPSTIAAGERIFVYITTQGNGDPGIVTSSSRSLGGAALLAVDTSNGLTSNSNAYVPGVAALRNYIAQKVSDLVASAPGALDTLNELATALGDDPSFATTVTTALAGKQPLNAMLTSLSGAADYAALRTLIGLAIGSNVQAFSTVLGYLAALTPAANKLPYYDTATSMALTNLRAMGITLLAAGTEDDVFTALHGSSIGKALFQLASPAGDSWAKLRADGSVVLYDAAGMLGQLGAAPLASPTFTGTPAAPTATAGDNTTKLATTAFVQAAIAALVNSSPSALDTLNELATALGNDPNFATTMTTALAGKQASNSNLSAIAALTLAAGKMIRWTGASTAVTQDISSTPAASTVPIADAGGKLDSWVSDASTGTKGKVQLASNNGTTSGTAVQADDYRLPGRTYLASDLSPSSSTTLADITGLGQAVVANGIYEVEIEVIFQTAAATTGINISVNGPASPDTVLLRRVCRTSSGQTTSFIEAYDGGTATSDVPASGTSYICNLKGTFINGANPGTFIPRFASEVGGSNVTPKKGSWMKLTRIA